MRVLSLGCSANGCEHNFTIYSFLCNKSRNRVAPEKAKSLVYIYTNVRVLRERHIQDLISWYDANILSKNSDFDVLGRVPVGEPNREFGVMRAEDEHYNAKEANRALQEYSPNPNLSTRSADHLDEAIT